MSPLHALAFCFVLLACTNVIEAVKLKLPQHLQPRKTLGSVHDSQESLIHIPLQINHAAQPEIVLQSLKLRQRQLPMLLEADEEQQKSTRTKRSVPLSVNVLQEKKLVTYFCDIQVQDKHFKVLLDTGSCEFWIPSTSCTSDRCLKHDRFPGDAPNEARFKSKKLSLNLEYLSGKVTGPFLLLPVKIGDLLVENQQVGIANVVDIELLDDVQWDGILGLAFPSPSLVETGITPFFDSILKSNLLKKRGLLNQFAYFIDDKGGQMTLGGADCTKFKFSTEQSQGRAARAGGGATAGGCATQFLFVPVTEKSYWTVTIQDLVISWPNRPATSGFCGAAGCKAIVDTGTYLLYGPSAQVNAILGNSIQDCEDYTSMPDITFVFSNGVSLTIGPIDYVLKFQSASGSSDCVVGISPDNDTIWTLGQVFLRSFYTIFDRDTASVGFARLPRSQLASFQPQSTQQPPSQIVAEGDVKASQAKAVSKKQEVASKPAVAPRPPPPPLPPPPSVENALAGVFDAQELMNTEGLV